MGKNGFEKYNNTAEECYEYEAIQNTKNLMSAFDGGEMAEAGCDTCIYYHNTVCDIFKRKNKTFNYVWDF